MPRDRPPSGLPARKKHAKCGYTHQWMALVRKRRGKHTVNWRCPRCNRCQHDWHQREFVKSPCRACKMHPCAAKKCGHEECRECGIGHGSIPATNGMCDSCRKWSMREAA